MDTDVKEAISLLLARLDEGLYEKDRACGWSEKTVEAMRSLLQIMAQSVSSRMPMKALTIVRGLDHWGVEGGELLEEFARLDDLYATWSEAVEAKSH